VSILTNVVSITTLENAKYKRTIWRSVCGRSCKNEIVNDDDDADCEIYNTFITSLTRDQIGGSLFLLTSTGPTVSAISIGSVSPLIMAYHYQQSSNGP